MKQAVHKQAVVKQAIVEQKRSLVSGRRIPEMLLAGCGLLLIAQATPGFSRLASALLTIPLHILSVLDVRTWDWTWTARAGVLNGLHTMVLALDFRNWSWGVQAGACSLVIVGLLAVRAWRNQRYAGARE